MTLVGWMRVLAMMVYYGTPLSWQLLLVVLWGRGDLSTAGFIYQAF